jgi:MFS family permease
VTRRPLATAVLLFLAAVDAAGYSIIAPVLPVIAETTGAQPAAMGALAAAFPLTMLPGLAWSGRSIRHGHLRRVLLVSLVLVLVGTVVFVASTSWWWLFLGRAVMGFGSGGVWMAVTLRTLEYYPGEGYQAMSRVYAAYSLGALIGPAIGALPGIHLPFAAYATLLVAGVLASLRLPAPPAAVNYEPDRSWRGNVGFWYSAVAIMLGMLAIGLIDGVLPLHFASLLSQWQIGLLYVAIAVMTAVSAVAAGYVRAGLALLLGVTALCIGLAVAGGTEVLAAWVIGLALVGVSAGTVQTGSTGVLLREVPAPRIISAMTAWSQLGILGYFLAPAIGGVVVQTLGYGALVLVPLALVVPLVVLALLTRHRHRA